MAIQQSESVKFLFDHVKSVWTLSAGGLAAGVALLGYIVKESRVSSSTINVLFGLGCLLAIGFYTYSIWNGLGAQVDLIQEVSDAEAAEAAGEEAAAEVSSDLIRVYKRGKLMFFLGCLGIILTALSFSVLNARAEKPQLNVLNISIKNAVLTMPDSSKVKIEDLLLQLPSSVGTLHGSNTVEITDLTFKVRVVASQP